jgi:LysR family hydrogen peroxide-inducible transcriptional activator
VRIPLNLQLLEPFVVLARVKNFTRAAEELHVTQPALTRVIQKLEDQMGQPLFERKPRDITLTDHGQLLFERAKEILKLVDNTLLELSEIGRRGRVRLGAIPTIAPYLLPTLLGSFAQQHPSVSVIVYEDTTNELIKSCTQGDVDLALVALPIASKLLESEALFTEELLVVLPRGHRLAKAEKVTIQDTDAYPFVLLNEAHCLSETILSFCRRSAVQPVSVEHTSQLATVLELVALGHGLSIVPEMARRLDLSNSRVYRSLDVNAPTRTVAMLWNPERFQSDAMKTLMNHVRRQVTQRSPPMKSRR